MKKKLISLLIVAVMCFVLISPTISAAQSEPVTLTVLNPKAHIETRRMIPLAERLDSFEGKTIGLYCYGKDSMGTVNFQQAMVTLLNERFEEAGATLVVLNTKGGVGWQDPLTAYEGGARAIDAMIFGVQN